MRRIKVQRRKGERPAFHAVFDYEYENEDEDEKLAKTLLATESQLAYSASDGETNAKTIRFDRGQLLRVAALSFEPG
jgi:hypothetical protein